METGPSEYRILLNDDPRHPFRHVGTKRLRSGCFPRERGIVFRNLPRHLDLFDGVEPAGHGASQDGREQGHDGHLSIQQRVEEPALQSNLEHDEFHRALGIHQPADHPGFTPRVPDVLRSKDRASDLGSRRHRDDEEAHDHIAHADRFQLELEAGAREEDGQEEPDHLVDLPLDRERDVARHDEAGHEGADDGMDADDVRRVARGDADRRHERDVAHHPSLVLPVLGEDGLDEPEHCQGVHEAERNRDRRIALAPVQGLDDGDRRPRAGFDHGRTTHRCRGSRGFLHAAILDDPCKHGKRGDSIADAEVQEERSDRHLQIVVLVKAVAEHQRDQKWNDHAERADGEHGLAAVLELVRVLLEPDLAHVGTDRDRADEVDEVEAARREHHGSRGLPVGPEAHDPEEQYTRGAEQEPGSHLADHLRLTDTRHCLPHESSERDDENTLKHQERNSGHGAPSWKSSR